MMDENAGVGRQLEEFMGIVMGMLIGTTPLIISQSSLPTGVAVILFFLTDAIIIDDWWMTIKITKRLDLNNFWVIILSLLYSFGLITLVLYLIIYKQLQTSLGYYLLIFATISLVDLLWCHKLRVHNKKVNQEQLDELLSWEITDIIAAIIYICGFGYIISAQLHLVSISLIFLALYCLRRILDVVTRNMISNKHSEI